MELSPLDRVQHKTIKLTSNPSLASSLQSPGHPRVVASLLLSYRNYCGFCSPKLASSNYLVHMLLCILSRNVVPVCFNSLFSKQPICGPTSLNLLSNQLTTTLHSKAESKTGFHANISHKPLLQYATWIRSLRAVANDFMHYKKTQARQLYFIMEKSNWTKICPSELKRNF